MANTNLNLVSQQRKAAEIFLKEHQDVGKIPKKISGVICARFGKYVNIWQYRNNKLVGTVAIDIKNIDAFYKKMQAAAKGFDYANIEPAPKEDDEEVEDIED